MRLTQSENWKVAMSGRFEWISPEAGDRSSVQFIVREVCEVLSVRAGKLAVRPPRCTEYVSLLHAPPSGALCRRTAVLLPSHT